MGRQSSRIFFQGKDHKEIFFRGHYHRAAYIGNQLVWEKLTDFIGKYWAYTLGAAVSNAFNAVLKASDKIRKYWIQYDFFPNEYSPAKTYFMHSDKYIAYMARTAETVFCRGCLISKNGVDWTFNAIDTSKLGEYIYSVVPKWDGVVIANNLNSSGGIPRNQYEYKYCPVNNGKIDQDNPILLYSDTIYNPTSMTIEQTTNFDDVLILFTTTAGSTWHSALAIDIDGNVYNDLFSLYSISSTHPHGKFNGMYWMLGDVFGNIVDGYYVNVYKTQNPYEPWREKRIFSGLISRTDPRISALQTEDYIVLYITYGIQEIVGEDERITRYSTDIYTTADFENYQKKATPDNLLIPIVGESYESEKKYVRFLLNYTNVTTNREDSYNIRIEPNMDLLTQMHSGNTCYIDDGKINPFNGMLIQLVGETSPVLDGKAITVYIGNLFYEESENNFAICEELYPNSDL